MSQEEIIKLNVTRVKSQLQEFFNQLKPEVVRRCKDLVFYDPVHNVKYTLDEIDFNRSCIFTCSINILPFISIYALQKINKVLYPDTTLSGNYSRIRTNYLYVESNEVRYSKLDLSSVDLDVVPEMYKPTSFLYKDLCIWKFVKDVGSGDNANMYRFCNERLEERYLRNQLDWVFFVGSYKEFKATYNTQLAIPVYNVVKVNKNKNKDVSQ